VERRTWLPACFNGVGNRLSGSLDRLSSRLNGPPWLGRAYLNLRYLRRSSEFSTATWKIEAWNGQSFQPPWKLASGCIRIGESAVGEIELPTFGLQDRGLKRYGRNSRAGVQNA
jgi:hypothetical protein